ncbi:MAG: HEAT repeat domain-containing protein [Deltaproteobacteria bacterium]|nr:HEAT repeat domain-containing protein [Deltaproteobacteria bacterium]
MSPSFVLALALNATPAEISHQLRALFDARDYVTARDELVRDAPRESLAELASRVSSEAFREAALAEVILFHRAHPDAKELLARPSGLIPAVYLKSRAARPRPLADLERAAKDATPLLFELYFFADAMGTYSAVSDFPSAMTNERRLELIAAEHEALEDALVHVIGRSRHPVATYLLSDLALATTTREGLREAAISALGETQDPAAVELLSKLARRSDVSSGAQAAALVGLSSVGSAAAFKTLVEASRESTSQVVRLAGLRATLRATLRSGVAVLGKPEARALLASLVESSIDKASSTGSGQASPELEDALVELGTELARSNPATWALVAKKTPAQLAFAARIEERVRWSERRRR